RVFLGGPRGGDRKNKLNWETLGRLSFQFSFYFALI
ncbi:hypothetical protein KKC_15424, partial [Listeria fleischmannii subsp. coloradonensis]